MNRISLRSSARRQRGVTLTYDSNGNITNDGVNTLSWDARNHLTGVSGPSMSATFQYDSFARRIGRTVNGHTTIFLYDGSSVIQELSQSTANLLSTGRIDETVLRTDGGGTVHFMADPLGSTIALLDAAGSQQTQYTYKPFGRTSVTGGTTQSVVDYQGRENDGTGLYYYRARYYSPSIQRFVSEDPAGFGGGDVNLYAFVNNSPTFLSDPTGLQSPGAAAMPFPTLVGAGTAAAGCGVIGIIGAAAVGGLAADVLALRKAAQNDQNNQCSRDNNPTSSGRGGPDLPHLDESGKVHMLDSELEEFTSNFGIVLGNLVTMIWKGSKRPSRKALRTDNGRTLLVGPKGGRATRIE